MITPDLTRVWIVTGNGHVFQIDPHRVPSPMWPDLGSAKRTTSLISCPWARNRQIEEGVVRELRSACPF